MPETNQVNTLETLIQLRRGFEEEWKVVGDVYVPFAGEPCVTLGKDGESSRIKIGDGVTTWNNLKYVDEHEAAGVVIYGYYFEKKFYSDPEHLQEIKGSPNCVYIDFDTNVFYSFDRGNFEPLQATVEQATAEKAGIVKIHDTFGEGTDGTMTQKAITNEMKDKVEMDVVPEEETLILGYDINKSM